MNWPATRGPSLAEEEEEEEDRFARPPLSSRTMSSRMASVDEEVPMWPATRGPSLEEEARCQASGMLPLEKECGQLSTAWQQPGTQMQCLAMRAASFDDESLAWDP